MITLLFVLLVWSVLGLAFIAVIGWALDDPAAVLAKLKRNPRRSVTVLLAISPLGTVLLFAIAFIAVILERKITTD